MLKESSFAKSSNELARFWLGLAELKITRLTAIIIVTSPVLQYCVTVGGSTYPSNLKWISLLQKRIIRVVNKEPFDAHTDPILCDLKILKFDKTTVFLPSREIYIFIPKRIIT